MSWRAYCGCLEIDPASSKLAWRISTNQLSPEPCNAGENKSAVSELVAVEEMLYKPLTFPALRHLA